MHWRIKGVVQKTVARLPGGASLHFLLQRSAGGLRNFEREFTGKLDDWAIMATHLANAGLDMRDARLMEIGTGWYPTLPFACHLAGAATVWTCDLNRHLKPAMVGRCIESLHAHLPRIASVVGAQPRQVVARWERLRQGWARHADLALATAGGIRYAAPADARNTGLPDCSVDAVFSNSVLEHVPPDVIAPLFGEAWRILRPRGLMFHSVNCGDHYAYFDHGIHQLNYLKYSDDEWKFWDNAFLYQNRLRAHCFVDAARDAGFTIALDTSNPTPLRLAQLRGIPLARQFHGVDDHLLCVTSIDFIGRKPALAAAVAEQVPAACRRASR